MVITIARWIIDQLILEHRLAIEMSSVRCLLEDPENHGWLGIGFPLVGFLKLPEWGTIPQNKCFCHDEP